MAAGSASLASCVLLLFGVELLEALLLVLDAAADDFVAGFLTAGRLSTFAAFGVGVVLHCHLLSTQAHAWPSLAVS